ncbi:hypothetical protein [Mycobacteroides chelonae]|uniref:hypothetical protein n=1 Tax=Mycobacteroides chelonae TaxID=1774 RepID=UPI001F388D91|nr:hypothetical protein [Mycobacteroides chelonae]
MSADERQKRDTLIMRLFVGGHSYREIARHPQIGLAHQTVAQIIHTELQRGGRTLFHQQASTIYLERMEMLLRAVWPQAIRGDVKAVETARRILAQEARFFNIINGTEPDWEDDEDELEDYRNRRVHVPSERVLDPELSS